MYTEKYRAVLGFRNFPNAYWSLSYCYRSLRGGSTALSVVAVPRLRLCFVSRDQWRALPDIWYTPSSSVGIRVRHRCKKSRHSEANVREKRTVVPVLLQANGAFSRGITAFSVSFSLMIRWRGIRWVRWRRKVGIRRTGQLIIGR